MHVIGRNNSQKIHIIVRVEPCHVRRCGQWWTLRYSVQVVSTTSHAGVTPDGTRTNTSIFLYSS